VNGQRKIKYRNKVFYKYLKSKLSIQRQFDKLFQNIQNIILSLKDFAARYVCEYLFGELLPYFFKTAIVEN